MEEEKVAEVNSDSSNGSTKAEGGGGPQGSSKLQVSDLNWTGLDPDDDEPTQDQDRGGQAQNPPQTPRGRGRPKGSKKAASSKDGVAKKRGRPKKVPPAEDLPNGGSRPSKRGRPKGSTKRKSETTGGDEDGGGSATPRQRGRPKKKPRLESSVSAGGSDLQKHSQKTRRGRPLKAELPKSTFNGMTKRRGRPRKNHQESGNLAVLTDGPLPKKRGRGRPKGSLNKKPPVSVGSKKLGRPRKVSVKGRKRGRPRQQPAKRGRPRKHPLPPPEELNKPKVWKPLGRPRKYPRVEPPEGAPAAPRRSRGRPRKSESKKGAHLRKSIPTSPPTPRRPNDGTPRKRGRPPTNAKTGRDTKIKSHISPSHKAVSDAEREAVPADSSDSEERRSLQDASAEFDRQV